MAEGLGPGSDYRGQRFPSQVNLYCSTCQRWYSETLEPGHVAVHCQQCRSVLRYPLWFKFVGPGQPLQLVCSRCTAIQLKQSGYCCDRTCQVPFQLPYEQTFGAVQYGTNQGFSSPISHTQNTNSGSNLHPTTAMPIQETQLQPELPCCTKCNTTQILQCPRMCCNKNCGQSFISGRYLSHANNSGNVSQQQHLTPPIHLIDNRGLTVSSQPPIGSSNIQDNEWQAMSSSSIEKHIEGIHSNWQYVTSANERGNQPTSTVNEPQDDVPDEDTDSFHSISSGSNTDTEIKTLQTAEESCDRNNNSSSKVKHGQRSYAEVASSPKADSEKSKETSTQDSNVDIDRSGLQVSQDRAISFTFHVIVPKLIWNWTSNSEVHIRFGIKELGSWNDCGNFNILRGIDEVDEFLEMSCTFKYFDSKLLSHNRGIPYKYVVLTKKSENKNDCYEFLHSYFNKKGVDYDRCLMLPYEALQACVQGSREYHHYDTAVYPREIKLPKDPMEETPSTSGGIKDFFTKQIPGALKSFFTKKKKDEQTEELIFPVDFELTELSLTEFFKPVKHTLLAVRQPADAEIDFKKLIENMVQIKTCLLGQKIHHKQLQDVAQDRNSISKLNEAVKGWLEKIVSEFEAEPIGNRYHQLTVAFFVICSVAKLYPQYQQLKKNFVTAVIKMVSLSDNLQASTCQEYTFLKEHLFNKERGLDQKAAVAYLEYFLDRLSSWTESEELCVIWFKALPVLHFLTGASRPFKEVGDSTQWEGDNKVGLAFVKEKAASTSSISKRYDSLKATFRLDPHTLLTFLEICSSHDLLTLCDELPPFIVLLRLKRIVSCANKIKKDKVDSFVCVITKTAANFGSQSVGSQVQSDGKGYHRDVVFTLTASQKLLCEIFSKLEETAEHSLELLVTSLKCVFKSASFLITVMSDNYNEAKKNIEHVFQGIHKAMKEWIAKPEVIGGSIFGGTVTTPKWKGKQELKVWQKLLQFDNSGVQASILDHWFKIARSILESRICETKKAYKWKLELFCLMESNAESPIHPILEEVIMRSIMEAIDIMQADEGQGIKQLEEYQSKRVGKVFGKILETKYPESIQSSTVSLNDLLHWHLWPKFFQVLTDEKKIKVREGLPDHCLALCQSALSYVEHIYQKLQNGTITIKKLKELANNKEAVLKLCVSSLPYLRKSKEVDDHLSGAAVQHIIDQRIREFKRFMQVHQELLQLCRQLESDRREKIIKGLTQVLVELRQDFDDLKVDDVCENNVHSDQIVVTHFESGEMLNTVATQFTVCTKKHGCDIFNKVWKEKLSSALEDKETFSLYDIENLVWKPTIQHFEELIHSLVSLQMTLADVAKYYKEFSNFPSQVISLLKCVIECTGNYNDPQCKSRLREALSRAGNYLLICAYHKSAKVFLELKDVLNLSEGDFSHLDTFSTNDALEGKTLQFVDNDLIESGRFLDDVAGDPKKIQCLENFLECQALVQWLRATAPKGTKDIKGFVDLAITTSAGGEDDLSHDKLLELQTVGSGLAPLIYDVKPGDGFQELKIKCETLWEVLKKKPNLPEVMVSCNKRLQWYQSVKDTQGDVETTSYGQMRNILKFGRFNIGKATGPSSFTIHSLVHMKLISKDKDLSKKMYTLDELRDLESKLVLICGDKADARTEVDHFLNILHSATRIAEIILKFQQVGNVEHSSINFEFTCASYDSTGDSGTLFEEEAKSLVESLQKYIKQLENILEDWETTIQQARITHYELNYFTTFQLQTLRKEMGKLFYYKDNQSGLRIREAVLMLMCSISPHVTETVVLNSLASLHEMSSGSSDCEGALAADSRNEICMDVSTEVDPGIQMFSHNTEPDNIVDEITAFDNSVLDSRASGEITAKDLNEEQHKTFMSCRKFLGYSEEHVLRAFKECGIDAEKEAIERWCSTNDDNNEDSDSETLLSDGEDGFQTDFSNESEPEDVFSLNLVHSQRTHPGTPRPKGIKGSKLGSTPIKLEKIYRCVVDELNPIVQQLLEAGYTLEESIEAVHLYGTLGPAMDYLDAKDMSGDDDDNSVPGEQLFQVNTLEENKEERLENDKPIFREYVDEDAACNYLTLDQLGVLLKNIHNQVSTVKLLQRNINNLPWLHHGQPNLVVVSKKEVLSTVLGIYMEDTTSSLPTFEEVLLCNEKTTAEEVSLLWHRAIFDPEKRRIFCLVHAERLTFQVCDDALKSLSQLSQGRTEYRIVIVCSKEEEEKSHIISRLHQFKRQDLHDTDKQASKQYLLHNFSSLSSEYSSPKASIVDPERSCVRVILSSQSGMGKSLYVQRIAEKLKTEMELSEDASVTIPMHGPVVTPDSMLQFFSKYMEKSKCAIYHLDVAPSILMQVDTILFSLLILRGLCDSQGNVWRCHSNQLYLIEITLLEAITNCEVQIVELLQLLPSVVCISPQSSLSELSQDPLKISMDTQMFHSHHFQRVYQYLKELERNTDLDTFEYKEGTVKGDVKDFIHLIMSKCGIDNPTWAEIHHFIKFLDIQLESSEKSVFCNQAFVRDVLSGMKGFVVKFMIRMSQDFSTPSLKGVLDQKHPNDSKESIQDLQQYQIATRRQWEHCKCGIDNPTWAEIHHFIKFLDIQLESSEKSVFCNQAFVRDVLSGMKGFVVKFMIRMSQDFSTPSLKGVLDQKHPNDSKESIQDLQQYQIATRRQWEHCPHPYLFFNNDGESKTITFVGFKVTARGDLIDPTSNKTLGRSIISKDLYRGLKQNGVNFQDDYRRLSKLQMIEKIIRVLGLVCKVDEDSDPDPSYVLTSDNLVKILAIQMRFRCDIPVVIMGETGCGKTRLIRYMCDLAGLEESTFQNMHILKIHGGVTEEKIIKFIERAEIAAKKNRKVASTKKVRCPETVVFFDEANTTDSIDLIKEIMCDRTCNGRPVFKDLKFIAACNPYRRHSAGMIQKLESAGLGFYVRAAESQKTLGRIPLRYLVYRVLDLPPSMRALVYDFGKLTTTTEHGYTSQIVKNHASSHSYITPESASIITNILAEAQKYMKEQKDECSFVSLRDVERAMIVFEFFVEHMGLFTPLIDEKAKEEQGDDAIISTDITRAMILSLSVCYHARLGEREKFELRISSSFEHPLELKGGYKQFRNEIKWCQEVLLDNMMLGPNIAKNAALRENVFMMAICIELRIPLFLVGKPGSSKSLAKSIIQDSMHGSNSENKLLQHFKQVQLISYQCSQLSTSESVIEVFKTAEKIQSRRDPKQCVSVVVLDEVGLAEDSPNLPLKALHPLLEDGTEGAGKHDEQIIVERNKRVAFIGISNWALDPAKMNRGVMVTRGTPGLEELIISANGICSNEPDDPIKRTLQPYIGPLSEAYMEIIHQQEEKEFFGLRDFYSLIKMLYWMCDKSAGRPLTWLQLEHAIKRNFGGSPHIDTFAVFERAIGYGHKDIDDYSGIPEELLHIVRPDCSSRALIKASLYTKDATWHGENRYLLFLTENYAALNVLEHYLKVEDLSSANQVISKPFILFGSSFPKDKDYTQVCRNINRIKICMETGRAVILLNLEHLYESLYDVLNQYYMYSGGNRYVDLGLQTHRMKCRVHKDFKLILIAEKNTVYKTFPTPLINRLEKHFVLASSVLENWQLNVLQRLEEWVKVFARTSYSSGSQHFREGHAFIGYQQDTAAAVIFQSSNLLSKIWKHYSIYFPFWQACQSFVLGPLSMEQFKLLENDSEDWMEMIFRMSQFLLLEIASDEALARLNCSSLDKNEAHMLANVYYNDQQHSSIADFLKCLIQMNARTGQALFMQVTTHAQLLTHEEITLLSTELDMSISQFDLHEFSTELDFSSRISSKFAKEAETTLIILQCDSGQENYDLIACARYRIYDESINSAKKNQIQEIAGTTHVLFIINLLSQNITSQFVGFQCDPWISVHIDDLRPTRDSTIDPSVARHLTISGLFIGKYEEDNTVPNSVQFMTGEDSVQVLDENPLISSNESEVETEVSDNSSETPLVLNRLDSSTESDYQIDSKLVETTESPTSDQDPVSNLSSSSLHQGSESVMVEKPSAQNIKPLLAENDSEATMLDIDLRKSERATQEKPKLAASQQPHSSESYIHFQCTRSPIIPQHWRLYSCIQAAVSGIFDPSGLKSRAKLRISKLTKLVPHTVQELGTRSFYSILVSHIHLALKRRERDLAEYEKDWVGFEARNPKKLQSGGTFRNVLSRRIDEVVTPIFSEVITKIDQNCNLNLLDEKNLGSTLSTLWLSIFNSLKIDSVTLLQRNATVDIKFKCKFPFSWLIYSSIEAAWTTIEAGVDHRESMLQLSNSLCETDVGSSLQISDEECLQFYGFYLHDFVRTAYKSNYGKDIGAKEYELITTALEKIVESVLTSSTKKSFIHRITSIHLVYKKYESEFLWFSELVHHNPGIVHSITPGMEMDLHLLATSKVLSSMKPPFCDEHLNDSLQWWLSHVRLSQSVINSVLSLDSQNELTLRLRENWQRIRALQIFVEQVLLPHSDVDEIVLFARRLNVRLSDKETPPNFLKKDTLESVKKVLVAMDKKIKALDSTKRGLIRNSCRSFFMEIISTLCFGHSTPPEDQLISFVMNIILSESGTRSLSPYKEPGIDKSPTIRSFLLQLLLDHNPKQVKTSLDDYFRRSKEVADPDLDQGLCLLCIQCFEDSLVKVNSACNSQSKQSQHLKECLRSGRIGLVKHCQLKGELSLEYLEAVAKIRFTLVSFAYQLKFNSSSLDEDLLLMTVDVCTDESINKVDSSSSTFVTGPILFLLKVLIRHYGFSFLMSISKDHQWIVPKVFKVEDHHMIDVFIVYQEQYRGFRDAIKCAVFENQVNELESLQDPSQTALLVASIYQQITLEYSKHLPENHPLPKVKDKLDEFVVRNQFLSEDLKKLCRLLLHNKQAGPLAQMAVSPTQSHENQVLTSIVVHTAAVVLSNQNKNILSPFVNMICNPATLADSYLPTMKEDLLQEFKAILTSSRGQDFSGAFYVCEKGHPYLIGNCGRPWVKGNCNICGAVIGGARHKLESGKKAVINIDTTKKGYDLEDPTQRTTSLSGERSLSGSSVCIVRAIMHSCFVWATCSKSENLEAIASITTFRITAQELPEFLWRCLTTDLQDLSKILGRGIEECAVVLHLVLRQIQITSIPTEAHLPNMLESKQSRKEWEKTFNETYIEPVMKSLTINLKKAMDFIANDDQQDHNKLFDLAYENVKGDEKVLDSHIWALHPQITTEHLRTYITRKKEPVKILRAFLEVEQTLCAMQYLPDIVKLQHYLFARFNRRLDKSKAGVQKFKEFLQDVKQENPGIQLSALFESLKKAWDIVGNSLCHYNLLPVEEKFLPRAITDDTEMIYIIPTTIDEGRCTTALVHFLVNVHNTFISNCIDILSSGSSKNHIWKAYKVQITQIKRCHFVQHGQHLQSVILSHCHYSLTVGKGQDVRYDLLALEKHILNQFIYGKPTIKFDETSIPNIAYSKDIYTAETFRAIREKVHPQAQLLPAMQQNIIKELRTPERLRESLDVVDIVLGLLSSGGGKADVPLKKYLDTHKMKKRPFSTKAKDAECTLGNIISLWETLSVELARQLWLSGQEPFESVPVTFTRDLSTHEAAELDKCLRKFHLGPLLGSLYEFIEVHVKNASNAEEEWELVDALEVYRNMTDQNELPNLQEFPKSISVAKAVATWKHIVNYQTKRN